MPEKEKKISRDELFGWVTAAFYYVYWVCSAMYCKQTSFRKNFRHGLPLPTAQYSRRALEMNLWNESLLPYTAYTMCALHCVPNKPPFERTSGSFPRCLWHSIAGVPRAYSQYILGRDPDPLDWLKFRQY